MTRIKLQRLPAWAAIGFMTFTCGAAVPTLENFFEGTQIRSVSISPDGKWLAMIATQ